MSVERETDDGIWVPAEPLPPSFGAYWEVSWKHRRMSGQSFPVALIAGWRDARRAIRAERNRLADQNGCKSR